VGLRAKLVWTFVGLLSLAIALLSLAYLDWNLKLMARALIGSADRISKETFEQVRMALSLAPDDPQTALQSDRGLQAEMRSALAFEDYAVFIRVVGAEGQLLASADGTAPPSTPPPPIFKLDDLARSALPAGLLRVLWSGQTYEMARPVDVNGVPFAVIEVGVSTALIAAEVHSLLWTVAVIALLAMVLTVIAALLAGNFLLHPVLAITSGVEQLAAGNADVSLPVSGGDELSVLAEKFNQLSHRLKSDRSRWESDRGNMVGSIRAMTDAALLIDREGALLFANREAQERLGLDANGLYEGKPLRLLLGPAHPLMQLVEPALSTGTEARGVAFRLDRAHGERTYLVSIFSLGQAHESAGLLVIMRDLQQVRELESIIEQSSRLARLGGLLSGVAHQIRKPLNVMMLQLELLRQDVEGGKALPPRIERIRHEIRRLDGIIDALMRFMRPEQLKLTQVDVNQLLREIGAQVAGAKTRIEYELAAGLPPIQADRDLLAEALKNIANNAVEAMTEGGVLSLRTTHSGDGFVTVRLSDQGGGIAPENLAHIFNLYFTTKEGGNGLGLSLAARAIDVQGGSIEVASEVGAGTTFTINLPTGQKAHDRLEAQA